MKRSRLKERRERTILCCNIKFPVVTTFQITKKNFEVATRIVKKSIKMDFKTCDAPKPRGPLTNRQPAEYKWTSGYPTSLQKIGQSLLCTENSTQIQYLHIPVPNSPIYIQYISNTATWAHKLYSTQYIQTISNSFKS